MEKKNEHSTARRPPQCCQATHPGLKSSRPNLGVPALIKPARMDLCSLLIEIFSLDTD